MNKILLISDNTDVQHKIQKNLVLLRATDKTFFANYEDAPDIILDNKPDIVLVHEHSEQEKTLNIIRYLREKKSFENINIILIADKYDRDFVLNSYDEGIDDYFTIESDPSEMLIRTINCIKKSTTKDKIKNWEYYLSMYGIISGTSKFINVRFAREILEFEVLKKHISEKVLMLIAPDENAIQEFSTDKFYNAIKSSVRQNDIVAECSSSKFYLLLNSDVFGAIEVLNKINYNLPEKFVVKAGIVNVSGKNFAELEKKVTCALNEALHNEESYVVYTEENSNNDDWLIEEEEPREKSFKFFKGVYSKKLDDVIAPIFYRIQNTYDGQISDTEIEQYTGEEQSVFRLVSPKRESILKIIYPGDSKVVVAITHSGLNSPENKELYLAINEITPKTIEKIVEDFIAEYRN